MNRNVLLIFELRGAELGLLRQGRSAFGRRGTRRSQTARAWPRAAQ